MPVLHKPQAEIDGQVGCAVAQLITALTSERNAIIQAGSILLIKVNGNITVRNLTQVEMAYLERNPTLLTAPAAMLDQLQQLNRGEYYPT